MDSYGLTVPLAGIPLHTQRDLIAGLTDLGYTDVVELDGGMMAWMADGRELLPPAA